MLQSENMARPNKSSARRRPFVLSATARFSLENRRVAAGRFVAALARAPDQILDAQSGHLLVRVGDLWAVAKDTGAAYEVLIVMSERDVKAALGTDDAKPNAA